MIDQELKSALEQIENHLEALRDVESKYLQLHAHEKVLYSKLFLQSVGKNIDEKKAKAYSSDDWVAFSTSLAEAESDYLDAKRIYELLNNNYYAALSVYKKELSVIRKQL